MQPLRPLTWNLTFPRTMKTMLLSQTLLASAFNGRPDPEALDTPEVFGGLKTWLFEGPKYIGSLWVGMDLSVGAV